MVIWCKECQVSLDRYLKELKVEEDDEKLRKKSNRDLERSAVWCWLSNLDNTPIHIRDQKERESEMHLAVFFWIYYAQSLRVYLSKFNNRSEKVLKLFYLS